jgi:hypothetical protein
VRVKGGNGGEREGGVRGAGGGGPRGEGAVGGIGNYRLVIVADVGDEEV